MHSKAMAHVEQLNDRQREAVLHQGSPLLVFAAAGTGKTQTLTARIAHLVLDQGVPPSRVLALTFTRRAAAEMRQRAAALCFCAESALAHVGTFHSACIRLLRRLGDADVRHTTARTRAAALRSDFTVLPPADALRLLEEHCLPQARAAVGAAPQDREFAADAVMRRIEDWRNRGLEPRDAGLEAAGSGAMAAVASAVAYASYRSACLEQQASDFSDLILHAISLLEHNPRLRAWCQARAFAHLLVDEFQDTNPAQMKLVELLCGWSSAVDAHVATEDDGSGDEEERALDELAELRCDDFDGGSLLSADAEEDNGDEEDRENLDADCIVPFCVRPGGRLGANSLMVVGDDYQAIHEWRGATVQNIMDFEASFPGAREVHLELNYRSRAFVLAAAGRLIAHNPGQREKRLVATRSDDTSVRIDSVDDRSRIRSDALDVRACVDAWSEAQLVASLIRRSMDENGGTGGDRRSTYAILFRTNAQSQPFEEALAAARVPFQLKGATAFFSRVEIRDCVAYARLLVNPQLDAAFLRVINTPTRGLGAAVLRRLDEVRRCNGCGDGVTSSHSNCIPSLMEAAAQEVRNLRLAADQQQQQRAARHRRSPPPPSQLTRLKDRALAEFVDGMEASRAAAASSSAAAALEACLERMGYLPALRAATNDANGAKAAHALEQLENVGSLLALAARAPEQRLSSFLDSCALDGAAPDGGAAEDSKDAASAPPDAPVQLMTYHASKGLEFGTVFMTGMHEGSLPYYRALGDARRVAEERRLAYVGVTRARDRLVLTVPGERLLFGGKRMPAERSRFLSEMMMADANSQKQ